MRKQPMIERFLPKIEIDPNGCWDWTGSLSTNGYGLLWNGSRKCNVRAHRFSFQYFNDTKIPTDREIDHLCRNHKCVNPAHLDLVFHRENIMRGDNPGILRQRMLATGREYYQIIGRLGELAGRGKPKVFKGRRQALKEEK